MANKSLYTSYRCWMPQSYYAGATTLDVFYVDKDKLSLKYYNIREVALGYNHSCSWSTKTWDMPIVGAPVTAIRNSGRDVSLFFVSASEIKCLSWDAGSTTYDAGWSKKAETMVASGITGSPAAVGRDETHMELVWVNSTGALKRRGWDYGNGGWMPAGEIMHADIVSNPSLVSRSSNSMDGVAIKNNGDLVHFWWDVNYSQNSGWQWEAWNMNVTGNPAIAIPSDGSYCCVAKVQSGRMSGYLAAHSWSSTYGHNQKMIPAKMATDPSAIAAGGKAYIAHVETNGDLVVTCVETMRQQVIFSGNALASTPRINVIDSTRCHESTHNTLEVIFWDKDGVTLRRIELNLNLAIVANEVIPTN